MAGTLFDDVFRAYNAPLEVEKAQTDIALEKTKVQAANLQLMRNVNLQSAMQKIWGVGGGTAAADSTLDPQAADMDKWSKTAQYLMQSGDTKGAEGATNMMANVITKTENARKAQVESLAKQTQLIGGMAGAILSSKDQGTYDATYPDLVKAVGPQAAQKLKLTGRLQDDLPKLQFLAKSGETYAQQVGAQDREQAQANMETQRGILNLLAKDRIGQGQARIDQAGQKLKDYETANAHRIQMDNNKDARAQEYLDMKKIGAGTRVAKVESFEKDLATGIFGTDERTAGLPPAVQQNMASMAAQIAKKYHGDQSFPEALRDTMDEMDQKGMFDQSSTTFGDPGSAGKTKLPPKGSTFGKGGSGAPSAPAPQGKTIADMQKDPKAIAIRDDNSMTRDQKKKALAALGY
jgi:hypothetical protein